jgi:branched-subunit amino acid ABC-type transport system permease component
LSVESLAVELLSAMTTAGSLFIIAAGLTLVFGAMRIANIAHGSFYMYGAFLVSTIVSSFGGGAFWVSLVAAPLIVATLGMVVEVTVLRRVYDKDHLTQLLATYAVFLILADLAIRFWGAQSRAVPTPAILSGSMRLGAASFPVYDLFVVGAAAAIGLGLWILLRFTLLGWRILAAVEDSEMLAAKGTNVRLLYTMVFGLGALLAGFGGAVVAPLQSIDTGLDANIIVAAFIVVVIGGLGSVAGAAVGAMIVGLFQALGILWTPSWAPAYIYLAMIVVLEIRPSGLFGTAEMA